MNSPMYNFVESMSLVAVISCVTSGEEWNESGHVASDSRLRKYASEYIKHNHNDDLLLVVVMANLLTACYRRLALIAIDKFMN